MVAQLIHAFFIPSQFNTHTYSKPFLDKKNKWNYRVTHWNPSKAKTSPDRDKYWGPIALKCLPPLLVHLPLLW